MEKYSTEGSLKTPRILFDLTKGILEIKGRSVPENPTEFYRPLFSALENYLGSVKPITTVTLQLEYFNTSSSKCILDIFKKLESVHNKASSVKINWNYEEDDGDMLEAGEDYQAMVNIPFNMVSVG